MKILLRVSILSIGFICFLISAYQSPRRGPLERDLVAIGAFIYFILISTAYLLACYVLSKSKAKSKRTIEYILAFVYIGLVWFVSLRTFIYS